jgi:hypothetical protein
MGTNVTGPLRRRHLRLRDYDYAELIESQEGGSRAAPTRTLGTVVNAFKMVSAKQINQLRGTPGLPVWQRNYYLERGA